MPDENYTMADVERLIAQMKADRLKRQASPTNAARPMVRADIDKAEAAIAESRKVRAALDAKLAASKAQKLANDAKAQAKAAAAALSVTPHLDAFNALQGEAKSAYYRQHEAAIRGDMTFAQALIDNPGKAVSRTGNAISISQRKS